MICTSLQHKTYEEILALLPSLEMAEIRLDLCPLSDEEIEDLFSQTDIPLIATCRASVPAKTQQYSVAVHPAATTLPAESLQPAATLQPTETTHPTEALHPATTPQHTASPQPAATPQPTSTTQTAIQQPTASSHPAATPQPTSTTQTATPQHTASSHPAATPHPTASPLPTPDWDIAEHRLSIAIEAGARFADLEIEAPSGSSRRFQKLCKECGTEIIRSYHNFSETPDDHGLQMALARCFRYGADIAKIVTACHSAEDAARLSGLYSLVLEDIDSLQGRLVAFGMGEEGRESRIACLRRGAPFTYAALNAEEATAPGQPIASELAAQIYGDAKGFNRSGLRMPASKSFAQRAILAAALAEGTSRLYDYSPCDDSEAALKVAQALGASVVKDGSTLIITGIGPLSNTPGQQPQSANFQPTPGQQPQTANLQQALGQQPQSANLQPAPGQQPQTANLQPAPGQQPQTTNLQPAPGQQPQSANSQPAPGQQSQSANSQPAPGQQPQTANLQQALGQQPQSTVTSLNSLDVGESGLLARLSIPVLAAINAGPFRIEGRGTLPIRPMNSAAAIMAAFGVLLTNGDDDAPAEGKREIHVPLTVRGKLIPGNAEVSGSGGSQLISGLLMALPMCAKDSTLHVTEPKSIPYMYITLDVLRHFGIGTKSEMEGDARLLEAEDWSGCSGITFKVRGGQKYRASSFGIESDWSAAANFLVAGAIFGSVELVGMDMKSIQADIAIIDVLVEAGALVSQMEDGTLCVRRAPLEGFSIDLNHAPDLFPIVAVLAAFCAGESRVAGLGRLAGKESDRAKAVLEMLQQMGVEAMAEGDELVVQGETWVSRLLSGRLLNGGSYTSRHDHRMAMALSVASIGAGGPILIDDTACVSKSFPEFFRVRDL